MENKLQELTQRVEELERCMNILKEKKPSCIGSDGLPVEIKLEK